MCFYVFLVHHSDGDGDGGGGGDDDDALFALRCVCRISVGAVGPAILRLGGEKGVLMFTHG